MKEIYIDDLVKINFIKTDKSEYVSNNGYKLSLTYDCEKETYRLSIEDLWALNKSDKLLRFGNARKSKVIKSINKINAIAACFGCYFIDENTFDFGNGVIFSSDKTIIYPKRPYEEDEYIKEQTDCFLKCAKRKTRTDLKPGDKLRNLEIIYDSYNYKNDVNTIVDKEMNLYKFNYKEDVVHDEYGYNGLVDAEVKCITNNKNGTCIWLTNVCNSDD